jgi:uncharacterized protein (DUF2267 family)
MARSTDDPLIRVVERAIEQNITSYEGIDVYDAARAVVREVRRHLQMEELRRSAAKLAESVADIEQRLTPNSGPGGEAE